MTHEFAGPQWIDEARRELQKTVATLGPNLEGVRFGICEIYTDPPAHLRPSDGGEISWHFVIDGATAEVGAGVRTDVDHTIRADYTVAIPFAKQPASEQERTFRSLPLPTVVQVALMGFHDHMAAVTR